jgi:hypothetical protein
MDNVFIERVWRSLKYEERAGPGNLDRAISGVSA